MNKTISIFLFMTTFLSCKFESDMQKLNRIRQQVGENAYYINYVRVANQFLYKQQTGEINLEFADRNLIRMNYANARNLEDLKKLFEDAGIIGAEELVILRFQAASNLKRLMKVIPELRELDREQLKYVMALRVTSPKPEIDRLFLWDLD